MDKKMRRFIEEILDHHTLMTFATVRPDGYPQATTVTYAHDGILLYFLCDKQSQKVKNLRKSKKISLTIETGINQAHAEWKEIKGISMGGHAEVLSDPEEIYYGQKLLTEKYSEMAEVSDEDMKGAAFIRITPKVISVINYELGFGHTDLIKVTRDDLKSVITFARKAA